MARLRADAAAIGEAFPDLSRRADWQRASATAIVRLDGPISELTDSFGLTELPPLDRDDRVAVMSAIRDPTYAAR